MLRRALESGCASFRLDLRLRGLETFLISRSKRKHTALCASKIVEATGYKHKEINLESDFSSAF